MTFQEFVKYAAGPGVSMIVAMLLALVVEWMPSFDQLQPKQKRLVFFALSFAVPVAAAVVGTYTGIFDGSWDSTFWPALVAGFAASGIGTLVHTPRMGAGDNA